MAEVGGDYEQVVLIEPRRQGFVQFNEFIKMIGGDDDGHDGRHLLEVVLQEGQLHFEAMLTGMRQRVIFEECGILQVQCPADFCIYGHFAQGRGIVGGRRVHRNGIEPYLMAGADEEDSFVMLLGVNAGEG